MNDAAVHDMWSFDETVRRFTQKLFEWSADPALRERREKYRHALLLVMEGLAFENPLQVGIAGGLIHDQFKTLRTWEAYQNPDKGLEIQQDGDS